MLGGSPPDVRVDPRLATTRRLFDAADVRVDHQVLDVGCGTGGIARQAARLAAAGHVRGVDLSRRMLDVGRALAAAEGLRNITFEQADAQVHPFPRRFHDRVLSCTGAMFFGDPGEAFANLRGSLVEGGRLVMLTWQPAARQEWFSAFTSALTGRTIEPGPDVPGPFSLSEPDRIQQVLHERVSLTSSARGSRSRPPTVRQR